MKDIKVWVSLVMEGGALGGLGLGRRR